MNRHQYQKCSKQPAEPRLLRSRLSSFSCNEALARDVQHCIGRRASVSLPSHPIQHSTIGDRIQIEQLHTMSQLTANSHGSADISYSGPPAHQNSSQSQSTFSASSRGPPPGTVVSRLNRAPSVVRPLNPARALLHLGKFRRVTSKFAASNSVSSVASSDNRRNGPLVHLQEDARSTWGTQGSFQTDTTMKSVDREELVRALREELISLFEEKQKELTGTLQTRQEEVSAIVMATVRESERAKAEELRTLRLSLDNISEEVKSQVDGLERKLDKTSTDLNAQMKDINLVSSRELDDQAQKLTTEFHSMAVSARDTFKEQLVEAKQELTTEGRKFLQVEGQRQIDVIKSFAKSFMTDLKNLAESATSSVVQKCQVPIHMVGSLFQTTCGNKSLGSDVSVDEACGWKTRTISPIPPKTQRAKRSSPVSDSHHHKRHKRIARSQSSTVETSITLDTKSVMRPRRTSRGIAAIVPLELRLSQKSNLTLPKKRNTRKRMTTAKKASFSQDTMSTISSTQGEAPVVTRMKLRHLGDISKETKSPASLKVRSSSLVTPLGAIEKAENKDGSLLESSFSKTQSDTSQRQISCNRPASVVAQFLSISAAGTDHTREKAVPERKSLKSSQTTEAVPFPVNEVVTANVGECSSPLSLTSAFHPKCDRARPSTSKKNNITIKRSTISTKSSDKGVMRLRRRSKRTYSKRHSSSHAADDQLTFSFHSEQ